jgi:spoIIIJ-associated protein
MSYRFSEEGRLDREGALRELDRFLGSLIGNGGFALTYRTETVDPQPAAVDRAEIRVSLSGLDQDLLLERSGELLQAIEYLAVRWLRLDPRLYDHVHFDAAGYRAARIEELRLSARIAARRVVETGQPFRFNPMPARERRILHLTLAENPAVRSESDGEGEERQVIVLPTKPFRPKR